MIYYANTIREARRMKMAMFAFNGSSPSVFSIEDRRGNVDGYRVQDDSIGNEWGTLIKCYLDNGERADKATPERVARHRDHSEIPTAHGLSKA